MTHAVESSIDLLRNASMSLWPCEVTVATSWLWNRYTVQGCYGGRWCKIVDRDPARIVWWLNEWMTEVDEAFMRQLCLLVE